MSIDIDHLSFEELLELNQRVVRRLKMLESMQAHVEMTFNLDPGSVSRRRMPASGAYW
jgi:hypothetical protein